MRKLFYGGLLAACVGCLSSCLEGGNTNEFSYSDRLGIVRFDMKSMRTVIAAPDFDPFTFYVPDLEAKGFSDGDCVIFSYSINLGGSENAGYQDRGYYQGVLSSVGRISQYMCEPYMTDTTQLIDKEQPVANAMSARGGGMYYSRKLFLVSDFSQKTGQKTTWSLYYDPEFPVAQNAADGRNVYSLFLRAAIQPNGEGEAPIVSGSVVNVFEADHFFSQIDAREKALGHQDSRFKINYIKEIKEDGTFTWAASDVITFSLPTED
jgi:hypothetical protein